MYFQTKENPKIEWKKLPFPPLFISSNEMNIPFACKKAGNDYICAKSGLFRAKVATAAAKNAGRNLRGGAKSLPINTARSRSSEDAGE